MKLKVIVSVNLILTYNLFQNNKGPYNAQLRYLVSELLQKLYKKCKYSSFVSFKVAVSKSESDSRSIKFFQSFMARHSFHNIRVHINYQGYYLFCSLRSSRKSNHSFARRGLLIKYVDKGKSSEKKRKKV